MGHVQPRDPPTLPILAQHSVWIPGVGESDSILFRSRKQVNNLSERDDPLLQVHSRFRRAAALNRNELRSVSDKHKNKWLCLDAIKSWLLSSAPTFFFLTKCSSALAYKFPFWCSFTVRTVYTLKIVTKLFFSDVFLCSDEKKSRVAWYLSDILRQTF